MFLRLQTQWQVVMGGFVGLSYPAVTEVLRLYEVKDKREMFEDLRVMERAALAILNKQED